MMKCIIFHKLAVLPAVLILVNSESPLFASPCLNLPIVQTSIKWAISSSRHAVVHPS